MAYGGGKLCRHCCLYPCSRSRTTTNKLAKDFCVLGVFVLLALVLLECFLSTNDKGEQDVSNDALKVFMTLEESNSKLQRSNTGGIHKGNNVQDPWLHTPNIASSLHQHNKHRAIPSLTPRSEGPVRKRTQVAQAKLDNQRAPGLSQRPLTGLKVSRNKVPSQIQLPSNGIKWQHVKNRTRKAAGGAVLKEVPQLLAGLRNVQRDQGYQAQLRFRPLEASFGFRELPVSRSTTPTTGEPWPMPQSYRITNLTSVYVIDITKMLHVTTGMTCDVMEKGVERHRVLLDLLNGERMVGQSPQSMERGWRLLSKVDIRVLHKCDQYPSLLSDESYELFIQNNTLYLHASEVWGALQGLQTLSQVITKSKGHLIMRDIRIHDFPRFKHRGVMLDTGRHYLSKAILLKNLDAMAMNKFNVFHWHLVDDQSFPYQSQVFPLLSQKGAYSRRAIYTQEDIRSVVEYARLRGIRVIPELDTPGHVESWLGLAEILTPCGPPGHYGPIDPTRNATYEKLTELFREVLDLFPAGTLHMGGDECSYYCWSRLKSITNFMKEHKMEYDFKALFNYYFTRLQAEMKRKLKTKLKNSIYWQEVFDEGVRLDSDAIVHVWKDDYTPKLSDVTRAGHRVVLSSCWYLNYIKYGKDWSEYYMCDPQVFAGTRQQKELVIGGEACMWGEYIDDNNLLSDLWPRASAVAERLWSAQARSNPYVAEGRFEEHRCRMIRRGIPAKAIGGPGPPCTDTGTP